MSDNWINENNEPDHRSTPCSACGEKDGHTDTCKVGIREANKRFFASLDTDKGKAKVSAEIGGHIRERRGGRRMAVEELRLSEAELQRRYESNIVNAPAGKGRHELDRSPMLKEPKLVITEHPDQEEENLCEHCMNVAPNGERFCSLKCTKCEHVSEDGCDGICQEPDKWQCGSCGTFNEGNDLSAACSECGERGDGTKEPSPRARLAGHPDTHCAVCGSRMEDPPNCPVCCAECGGSGLVNWNKPERTRCGKCNGTGRKDGKDRGGFATPGGAPDTLTE